MRKSLLLLAVWLASLAVVACAGEEATTPGTGTPTGASGQPIKIGLVLPFVGVYASLAESQANAARLAVDEINAAGGVLGRPLQLIIRDDKLQTDEAARQAQSLIQQERVDMIAGTIHAGGNLAINSVTKAAGVLYFATSATDTLRKERGEYTFHTAWAQSAAAPFVLDWVSKNLGRRWWVIYPDYAYGHEWKAILDRTASRLGVTIVGETMAPLGTTDFSSYIPSIARANPEVVYVFSAGGDMVNFFKQATAFGLFDADTKIMAGITDLTIDKSAGYDLIANTHALLPFYWGASSQYPSTGRFAQAYRARYGVPPDGYAAIMYDTIKVYAEAVKKAGTTDPRRVAAAVPGSYDFTEPIFVRQCDGEIARTMIVGRGNTADQARQAGDPEWALRQVVASAAGAESMLPPCGQ
jgi:branched-chain amino acid transport system substrate-binding protein